MSQSVRFVKVEDTLYPDLVYGMPDLDEAIGIVSDMLEDGLISPSDEYEVITYWYEIGEGESGMDWYFSDEILIRWESEGNFEKFVEKFGYDLEKISDDRVVVNHDQLEE